MSRPSCDLWGGARLSGIRAQTRTGRSDEPQDRDGTVLILPAIDLRGGQCVRLRQGDYAQETVFGDDPAAMARRWVEQGADLPAPRRPRRRQARAGRSTATASARIVEAAGVPCQLGGGLRTEDAHRRGPVAGASRASSSARGRCKDPAGCEAMCRQFPGKIVLGIDARDGQVATDGWLRRLATCRPSTWPGAAPAGRWPRSSTPTSAATACWQGPNVDAMAELAAAVPLPVIASGGVTTLDDVRRLAAAAAWPAASSAGPCTKASSI